jgi:hypothetical protein
VFGYGSKHDLLATTPLDLRLSSNRTVASLLLKNAQMIDIAVEKGSHRFEGINVQIKAEFPVEVLLTAIPQRTVTSCIQCVATSAAVRALNWNARRQRRRC